MKKVQKVDLDEFLDFRQSLQLLSIGANDQGLLDAIEDSLRNGEVVYGAFHNGDLVGLIECSEEAFRLHNAHSAKEMLIGTIFVHPAFRDQGIGKELVQFVVKQAKTEYVVTDPIDQRAQEFFTHCGFMPNEIFQMDEGGDWMMVLPVSYGKF
ncbi:GNAT family N-acetyltransferase [Ammoniphilus sp. CFH 90114]|uniref:GNAT family N-acetyltransferase n=1 Tax=Ammoniphilus sp. CFH 90114 TaxID=2493665 RepID=UPI00100DFFB3|nr:GNAT family N-acetyltransferase [Ammoniphilus sp. CFH 90114]RXT15448.1 GNAT family N-acetyltransferase [Ammoniphilus sp. CFH 90114]